MKKLLLKLMGANDKFSLSQVTLWAVGLVMGTLQKTGVWEWIPGEIEPEAASIVAYGIGAAVAYFYHRFYMAFTGQSPASGGDGKDD